MKLVVLASLLVLACATPKVAQPALSNEPGLWKVCYDAQGLVDNFDGECEHSREITWDLPVRVYVPADYPDRLRVLESLAAWNDWLQADVFLATTNPVQPDVEVIVMSDNPVIAGLADHALVDGRVYFKVYIAQKYTARVDILAHEFGHVLGLAHDPGRKRSIMHPGAEWYLPRLSGNDCALLARKYKLKKARCTDA